jgi:hypothetical protein
MTNEEINALTDQQINVMVTAEVNDISESYHESGENKDKIYQWYSSDELRGFIINDYCNDPAVMMPIVFANGISLIKTEIGEGWTACFAESWNGGWDLSFASNAFCEHTNPLRAAAIVYLKMKGVL